MITAVIAIFSSFSDAESVLTELIRDGFPPGRVKLTARLGTGPAVRSAPESRCDEYARYFETFFAAAGERSFAGELAKRVASGCVATVAVHPHSEVETARATEILENQGALQVVRHELETAALPDARPWLDHLIPEHAGAAGRFCFRSLPDADTEYFADAPT